MTNRPWYKDTNFWIVIGEIFSGVVAFGLIITGFFLPPMGSIDSSVIQAVGEIFAFAALWQLPAAIRAGKQIRLEHGNTTITVNNKNEQE